MRRLSCDRAHCRGQYYLENQTLPSEDGGVGWIGFEVKCLLCSRPHPAIPTISAMEMLYLWEQQPGVIARARWNTLTFLWLSDRMVQELSHAAT